jgi:hypothetical protein
VICSFIYIIYIYINKYKYIYYCLSYINCLSWGFYNPALLLVCLITLIRAVLLMVAVAILALGTAVGCLLIGYGVTLFMRARRPPSSLDAQYTIVEQHADGDDEDETSDEGSVQLLHFPKGPLATRTFSPLPAKEDLMVHTEEATLLTSSREGLHSESLNV